jgi:tRNA A-37 threonylcarbamoyl transferase component Bud32
VAARAAGRVAVSMMAAETKADPLVGQVLEGNYRATRFVGRGAMGSIYEATQLRLNKRVAIKVISRDLAENPLALQRFRREAEVTSQLGHPHIVNVFDFGTTPLGDPFMAMEFLEGEDLETRIRRVGKLPLPAVTLIVRQVASALAATHSGGIVHRDLKPANIFLVRVQGEPEFTKVVDFGISKVHAGATRLTKGLLALGTPQFMAPEQAASRLDEIDHRVDQWALACIAFEALCGRPPFRADEPVALVYQILHEDPPPLRELQPDLPAALQSVFNRALAKGVNDRFENISAFGRAFEIAAAVDPDRLRLSPAARASGIAVAIDADERTVFDDKTGPASWVDVELEAPARPRLPRLVLVAAAVVLALTVALSLWWLSRQRSAAPAAVGSPTEAQPPAPAAPLPAPPRAASPAERTGAATTTRSRSTAPDQARPAPAHATPASARSRRGPSAGTRDGAAKPPARPRAKRQLIEEL